MARFSLAACCTAFFGMSAAFWGAAAKGYTVLYSFAGSPNDGSAPAAALLMDKGHNLYGTTVDGGAIGDGTVFKLTPGGTETVLHSFCSSQNCSDGYAPSAGLIEDKSGNLYGTAGSGAPSYGGIIFKIAPGGTETVLYTFCAQQGCTDGYGVSAGVIEDKAGNFYGTTVEGGGGGGTNCYSLGCGTVFKLAPDGTESVLHAFQAGNDGALPFAGLLQDRNGNLYGTTTAGGSAACGGIGCGTIFEVTAGGSEKVLHSFAGGSDGAQPIAGLIRDDAGNLYGTTVLGGGTGCGGGGCGTVFELPAKGSEKVLYSFCSQAQCSDGMNPYGGVVEDGNGNLYGTTEVGGNGSCTYNGNGCGTIFRLAPGGALKTLYSFCAQYDCSDGFNSAAGLIMDRHGHLYGTAEYGGSINCDHGCGTVFKLKE